MIKLKESKCDFCQIDLFGIGKTDCSGWIATNHLAVSRVFIILLSPILYISTNNNNTSTIQLQMLGYLLEAWQCLISRLMSTHFETSKPELHFISKHF